MENLLQNKEDLRKALNQLTIDLGISLNTLLDDAGLNKQQWDSYIYGSSPVKQKQMLGLITGLLAKNYPVTRVHVSALLHSIGISNIPAFFSETNHNNESLLSQLENEIIRTERLKKSYIILNNIQDYLQNLERSLGNLYTSIYPSVIDPDFDFITKEWKKISLWINRILEAFRNQKTILETNFEWISELNLWMIQFDQALEEKAYSDIVEQLDLYRNACLYFMKRVEKNIKELSLSIECQCLIILKGNSNGPTRY